MISAIFFQQETSLSFFTTRSRTCHRFKKCNSSCTRFPKKKEKVLQLPINYAPHLNFKKVIISYNYFREKISPPHLTHPPTLPNSINPKTHHKMRKKKKKFISHLSYLEKEFFFILFRIFFLNRCDMGLNLSESWQQVNFKYEWCSKNTR